MWADHKCLPYPWSLLWHLQICGDQLCLRSSKSVTYVHEANNRIKVQFSWVWCLMWLLLLYQIGLLHVRTPWHTCSVVRLHFLFGCISMINIIIIFVSLHFNASLNIVSALLHLKFAFKLHLFLLLTDLGQVISVYGAEYGRRDQTTCSYRRPTRQVTNVHCPANPVASHTCIVSNRYSFTFLVKHWAWIASPIFSS